MQIYIGMALMPQNSKDLEQNLETLTRRLGSRINFRIAPSMIDGRAQAAHVIENKEEAQNKLRAMVGDLYRKHLKAVSSNEKNVKLNNCGFGETFSIASNGDIFPCNLYEKRIRMGNVRESNIQELLQKLKEIRNAVSVESIPECRNCPLKIVCYGGCRLNNFYKHGTTVKASCTPERKQELLEFIVKKEETFDPMQLWLQGEDKQII